MKWSHPLMLVDRLIFELLTLDQDGNSGTDPLMDTIANIKRFLDRFRYFEKFPFGLEIHYRK